MYWNKLGAYEQEGTTSTYICFSTNYLTNLVLDLKKKASRSWLIPQSGRQEPIMQNEISLKIAQWVKTPWQMSKMRTVLSWLWASVPVSKPLNNWNFLIFYEKRVLERNYTPCH